MKNIYFLESAPQLLSAYQASSYYPGENIFLIRLNGDIVNDNQIKETICTLNLAQSGSVFVGKANSLSMLWRVLVLSIHSIFINLRFLAGDCRGGYTNLYMRLMVLKETVLLDDGIASINYYWDQLECPMKPKNEIRYDALYTALPLSSNNIVNHQFESLEERLTNVEIDESLAYFIGSKVVEVGLLSEGDFIKSLDNFVLRNKGKKLVYIAHRAESLEKVRSNYSNFLEVKVLDLPVELEFLKQNVIPGVIEGFYTGAFLFLYHINKNIDLRNHPIARNDYNYLYHEEILRCDRLFDKLI